MSVRLIKQIILWLNNNSQKIIKMDFSPKLLFSACSPFVTFFSLVPQEDNIVLANVKDQ